MDLNQQIQIIWQADDPDGDRLVYSIYFRGEDENEWKLLRENFNETMLTLEGDVLADGRYLFRVVASDKASNSGDSVRQAELGERPRSVRWDAPSCNGCASSAEWQPGSDRNSSYRCCISVTPSRVFSRCRDMVAAGLERWCH